MYQHIIKEGDAARLQYRDGLKSYIKRLNAEAYDERERSMPLFNFAERIEEHRARYVSMLGLDRISDVGVPAPTLTRVGEDEDAVIYRVIVYITPEIPQYGLLFVPHGATRLPLIVAQHGGSGTPELCSDMNGQNNYAHMTRRVLRRGAVVYAPQLLLWNYKDVVPTAPIHDIPHNRIELDKEL
ncbi:MAG: hypothetical protein J6R04_02115, partial [Clostridia bacterium]|nr:hypothetical protein [Clostridia bacterium]